jgi:hypothetical protein
MKLGYNVGIAAVLLVLTCSSSFAAEIANLRNGFAIRHERHEAMGNVTRLYLTATPDNYLDVPSEQIVSFEKEDSLPKPVFRPVPTPTLDEVISAASSHNSLDPDLINSVIRAESGFNSHAVSPKGAQGLMQLMPRTAMGLGVKDAMDPVANVEGGTRYLRELLTLYDNDLIKALAAYNAGPERVQQYKGVPPYPETITYISRVVRDFNRKKLAQRSLTRNRASGRNVSRSSKVTSRPARSESPSQPMPESPR